MNRLIASADYCGMTASVVCVLHCLATPVLLIAFPLLATGGDADGFHRAMALIVSAAALLALLPGFLAHRNAKILLIGTAGLTCFIGAIWVIEPLYGETAELVFSTLGGALMFTAHFRNRRSCCHCAAKPA